ncbi:MAG: NAD(P)H-dependent oxidoreductase [Paracoccaceae bacterium]
MSESKARRCLIVTCHPLAESLCMLLADHAEIRARSAGWEVERRDLYRVGFAPALTAAERASTYAAMHDSGAVASEIEILLRAEAIILVFPTWWFGLPTSLMGWIRRSWAPGVTYERGGILGRRRGELKRLRHLLAITTIGAPAWLDFLAMRRPLQTFFLKGCLVVSAAPRARFGYLAFHSADNVSGYRLAVFQAAVDRAIERL